MGIVVVHWLSIYSFCVHETSNYCARGADIIQSMKYIRSTCTIIAHITRAKRIYDETRDIYCSVLISF